MITDCLQNSKPFVKAEFAVRICPLCSEQGEAFIEGIIERLGSYDRVITQCAEMHPEHANLLGQIEQRKNELVDLLYDLCGSLHPRTRKGVCHDR
jgi:hypothetical protein